MIRVLFLAKSNHQRYRPTESMIFPYYSEFLSKIVTHLLKAGLLFLEGWNSFKASVFAVCCNLAFSITTALISKSTLSWKSTPSISRATFKLSTRSAPCQKSSYMPLVAHQNNNQWSENLNNFFFLIVCPFLLLLSKTGVTFRRRWKVEKSSTFRVLMRLHIDMVTLYALCCVILQIQIHWFYFS